MVVRGGSVVVGVAIRGVGSRPPAARPPAARPPPPVLRKAVRVSRSMARPGRTREVLPLVAVHSVRPLPLRGPRILAELGEIAPLGVDAVRALPRKPRSAPRRAVTPRRRAASGVSTSIRVGAGLIRRSGGVRMRRGSVRLRVRVRGVGC